MALGLSLLAAGFGLAGGARAQAQVTGAAQEVVSYTVRPGDTLWTYARMVTPEGGDVSGSVDELMGLNGLTSPVLQTGQRIVVPKR
ncbi:peptidoglycan-binding protein [Bifidobacterium xylocopae]|uniref:Peptidoglycan-binding protein n=2 Tax=Bifidobacterium xylocopae TaxID=2493119 RepID=A0A366KD93_9BIFI|nr:peptidoglycan-binding protein [Bifidobacterium xylocopae]